MWPNFQFPHIHCPKTDSFSPEVNEVFRYMCVRVCPCECVCLFFFEGQKHFKIKVDFWSLKTLLLKAVGIGSVLDSKYFTKSIKHNLVFVTVK